MTYAFNITLVQETTNTTYELQIPSELSFLQLHKAITTLYALDCIECFSFQLLNITLHHDQKEITESIHTYIHNITSLTYHYETAVQSKTIHITLQRSQKSRSHPIQLIHPTDWDLQKQLNDSLKTEYSIIKQNLQTLLDSIRKECMQLKTIAPYLMMFQKETHTIPYYLDVLDNGLELMIFPDENCFARSIINSDSDDPDLLFTNAYIFDFLYEEIDDSELLLFDHHNLCFKLEQGTLPAIFDELELGYIYNLLRDFYKLIKKQNYLPSFGEHKMLVIEQDGHDYEAELTIKEDKSTLYLNSYDEKLFQSYPHTNEVIRLFFQASPKENSKETGMLDIRICAANTHFHKEQLVTLSSMDVLHAQIEAFMKQIFNERGLAEKFILSSKNLAHIVSGIYDQLHISYSLYSYENTSDMELLDMICDALCMSKDELLCSDSYEEMHQVKLLN